MRIWTLHPRYLDRQGLLAVWREGLLAQAVLLGRTKGYTRHPQLERFRNQPEPVAAIGAYLAEVCCEAGRRGYAFDATRIVSGRSPICIPETRGQLLYEWRHFKAKLRVRAPSLLTALERVTEPCPHPIFRIVAGDVRNWERITGKSAGGARGPAT